MAMTTALHMFADNSDKLEEQWKQRDAEAGIEREEAFYDLKFRVKKKDGEYKEIPAPEPALEGPVADVHCHLSMLDNRDLSLARSAAYNINLMVCVTDIVEDAGSVYSSMGGWIMSAGAWQHVIDKDSFVFDPIIRLTCGCHPHNAKDYNSSVESGLLERLADKRTCALGEIGLDYHYDFSPRDRQQKVFRRQLQLAHRTGLPVQLHIREAHEDALRILDEEGMPEGGCVLHCCTLGPKELEPWLERDCYISVGGSVTFASCDDLRESVKIIPANRLLTETDSPYMAPVPLRGRKCSPEFAVFTAEKIAQIRGCEPGDARRELLATMFKNARDLFDRGATTWQMSAR